MIRKNKGRQERGRGDQEGLLIIFFQIDMRQNCSDGGYRKMIFIIPGGNNTQFFATAAAKLRQTVSITLQAAFSHSVPDKCVFHFNFKMIKQAHA